MGKTIKIGGASGYWGESAMATPQLLASGDVDYLVYDYLAEITMSITARVKAKDPSKGFATDFVDFVMKPHLLRGYFLKRLRRRPSKWRLMLKVAS